MITVKEVVTKNDFKQFVEFPYQLYRNCNYYIFNYINAEYDLFSPGKNSAYEYCECQLFLCVDGEKVLGRIATIINHRYNEEHNTKELRFFYYDAVDNLDVTTALINKVKNVAIENGLNTIVGDMGFNQFNHYGILTEGYDQYSTYDCPYNHSYYVDHLTKLNFREDVSWHTYKIKVPEVIDKRMDDVTNVLLKKYDLKLIPVTNVRKNELLPDLMMKSMILRLRNYDYLYSFNTLTDKEIENFANRFKMIIQLNSIDNAYYFVVTDKNDEVVGFILGIPSLAKLLSKMRLKIMIPISILYKRATAKSDAVDLIGVVVKKEYQNLGVSQILQNELFKMCKANNVKYINTDFDFDLSPTIKGDYEKYNMEIVRTCTSFRFDLIN